MRLTFEEILSTVSVVSVHFVHLRGGIDTPPWSFEVRSSLQSRNLPT